MLLIVEQLPIKAGYLDAPLMLLDSAKTIYIILLMIPNKEGWHYIAVKKLTALLKRITLKHTGDDYCLNCLYLFRTKSKLESHK